MYVVETLPINNNTLNTLANMLPAPKTLVINDNCSQMEYDTYVSTLQAIHAQLVTDRGLIYTRHMEVCLIPLSRDVWHILFRYLVPNKPDGGTDSDKTDCYSTIHNEILDYLQDIYCRFVLHCYDSTAGANSGDQQGMDTDMYDSNGNNHTTPHSDWPRKVSLIRHRLSC